MCSSCIGLVNSRRARAEKRREEKIGDNATRSEAHELQQLARGVVAGREYDCVSTQVCQINDLKELLQDTKVRLSNCMEISKINAVRQGMISSSESQALF